MVKRKPPEDPELGREALYLVLLGDPGSLPPPPPEFCRELEALIAASVQYSPPLLQQDAVGLAILTHAVKALPGGLVSPHTDTCIRRALAAFAWGASSALLAGGFTSVDDLKGDGPWDRLDAGVLRARRFHDWLRETMASTGTSDRLRVAQGLFAELFRLPSKENIRSTLWAITKAAKIYHRQRGSVPLLDGPDDLLSEIVGGTVNPAYTLRRDSQGPPALQMDVRATRDKLRTRRWGGAAPPRRLNSGPTRDRTRPSEVLPARALDTPVRQEDEEDSGPTLGELLATPETQTSDAMRQERIIRVARVLRELRTIHAGDESWLSALDYLEGARDPETRPTREEAATARGVTVARLRYREPEVEAELILRLRGTG